MAPRATDHDDGLFVEDLVTLWELDEGQALVEEACHFSAVEAEGVGVIGWATRVVEAVGAVPPAAVMGKDTVYELCIEEGVEGAIEGDSVDLELVLEQDLFDVGVSEGCFGVEQDGEHGDADFGFSQSALADSAGGGMS
ncbi:MAG: hypothetical protein RBU37_28160, partial [Myxococcota bacterium]|nr:hypothetical protein [Myxococcota bacterium]